MTAHCREWSACPPLTECPTRHGALIGPAPDPALLCDSMRWPAVLVLASVAGLTNAESNSTDPTSSLVASLLSAVSSGSGSLFSDLAYTLLPTLPQCGRFCLDALVIPPGVFSCLLGAGSITSATVASPSSAGFRSGVLACLCAQHDLQLNLYRCATDKALCGDEPDRNTGVEALVSLCGSQGVVIQTAQLASGGAYSNRRRSDLFQCRLRPQPPLLPVQIRARKPRRTTARPRRPDPP